MNKMTLEQLAKKTKWIQGACRGIRNFYENRPPYLESTYIMMSITHLVNETGIRIKEIKSKSLR